MLIEKLTDFGQIFNYMLSYQSSHHKDRHIIFYSEGRHTWAHLKNILGIILDKENCNVSYVTSSNNDPGLLLKHSQLTSYYFGNGHFLNYFFQNASAQVLITSSPDLGISKFKKSKFVKKYIYIPHSICSLHMIYKKSAFDNFDVICSVGPHHDKELRILENKNGSSKKKIIPFGYPRVAELKEASKKVIDSDEPNKIILLAPSWGLSGLIETGNAEPIIEKLLESDYRLILRPHPQTVKNFNKLLNKLCYKFNVNSNFSIDLDPESMHSLIKSDILITDWSGISMEYAFGLYKPTIFLDINKKINNEDFNTISLDPIEVSIRNKIGVICNCDCLEIKQTIDRLVPINKKSFEKFATKYVYANNTKYNKLLTYISEILD